MPHLEFLQGERALFLHALKSGRNLLGRSDRCDLALPSDSVSRVHCIVEERNGQWWLTDRSRHGTLVNGEPAPGRRRLTDGDVLTLGIYQVRFSRSDPASLEVPTAASPLPVSTHEEVLEVGADGFTTLATSLVFLRGPHRGREVLLSQPTTTVGGKGSDVLLDPSLPRACAQVLVVRGRPMIRAGEAAVLLAGARVRATTPVLDGEEIRIGQHGFTIEADARHDAPPELDAFGRMVGSSRAMRRLFGMLGRMASYDHPALLLGESGTGKELAAQALHDQGTRHEGPFVPVNCAGVPEALFESELFGHERGAFTGAAERQDGAFQRADGGTLFLDEVGELPLDGQAKLLRALESGEVRRVGGHTPEFPDVRVVGATNRNLPLMVADGRFRSDLYFRLSVLTVTLPPLRERNEDIPNLARTLLARSHPDAELTEDALEALQEYNWPGNVRELRNVLTRAYVLRGKRISSASLAFNPWAFEEVLIQPSTDPEDHERVAILTALRQNRGNKTKAARDLGIPRSTLLYKLKRLKIEVS